MKDNYTKKNIGYAEKKMKGELFTNPVIKKSSNSLLGDIEDFELKKIKDGKGEVVIFIDGFLSQGAIDTNEWESQLKKIYPENPWYYLSWESKRLKDLHKYILSSTFYPSKKSVLLNILKLSNNPWYGALSKAGKTGQMLAKEINGMEKKFILCGHSLGARVIYFCLKSLSKHNNKIIKDVHLLGGAVGNTKKDWAVAKVAVSGEINNYKSDNDSTLKYLYKFSTFLVSKPIGSYNIEVNGINNIDVTSLVKGHTEYKCNFVNLVKFNQNQSLNLTSNFT